MGGQRQKVKQKLLNETYFIIWQPYLKVDSYTMGTRYSENGSVCLIEGDYKAAFDQGRLSQLEKISVSDAFGPEGKSMHDCTTNHKPL
jgi:hypothetical protein